MSIQCFNDAAEVQTFTGLYLWQSDGQEWTVEDVFLFRYAKQGHYGQLLGQVDIGKPIPGSGEPQRFDAFDEAGNRIINHQYCVKIKTCDQFTAGTDGDVKISIFGPESPSHKTADVLLDKPGYNDFERVSQQLPMRWRQGRCAACLSHGPPINRCCS